MSKFEGENWYILREADQEGPYEGADIKRKVESGALNHSDFIWRPGLETWLQAGTFRDLYPPPPPHGTKTSDTLNGAKKSVVEENLQGLGGWLTFVGTNLVLTPLFSVADIIGSIKVLSNTEIYSKLYNLLFVEFILVVIIFVIAPSWLTFLFFTKKNIFKNYFISWVWISIAFALLDILMAREIAPQISQMDSLPRTIAAIFWAAIWTLYMRKSRRVRATFTVA